MRIVSLLPSATEIVCALGLRDQLVGVSHSCDYPAGVEGLPVVTDTVIDDAKAQVDIDVDVRERLGSADALYTLNMDTLRDVKPDIILTQDLCTVCAVSADEVETALCTLPGTPQMVNMDPTGLVDVLETISQTATVAGIEARGRRYRQALEDRIEAVRNRTAQVSSTERPRVAFIEWLDPPFNGGHWMPELIESAGGIDVLGNPGMPSTTIDWPSVVHARPDLIFISCCGFPIDRTVRDLLPLMENEMWRLLMQRATKGVFVSDGNAYFARPGPRLVDSLEIMAHACHPQIHPATPFMEDGLRKIC